MTGTRKRIVRLLTAAALVLPLVVTSLNLASFAAPSAKEVEAAKAKLASLQHDFEALTEQYNEARYRLTLIERKLAEAKAQRDAAQQRADAAEGRLAQRAVQAYVGTGTQLDGLLGAESIGEFSDRLEYMGALAESDAAVALDAKNARQEADWAAARYADAAAERRRQVQEIEGQLSRLDGMIADQATLYGKLKQDRQDYLASLAAQRAALEQARQEAQDNSFGETTSSDTGGFVPPVNATAAQIAVSAAQSVLGTQYVWGSADPNVGFDCSGLTSWAWGQAGVYIPHSSAAQYSSLPHVPLSQVQPGDLIFYYSPISHVAMYIGGGQIIHATHPGADGAVHTDPMYGYGSPVGASRPG
jgi:cell wall-associated NlpC family hydrolase